MSLRRPLAAASAARRAFTLSDLLILVGLSVVVSAWALPKVMAPRSQRNEDSAIALLRMQGVAQLAWRDRAGTWAKLKEIVFAPPSARRQELPWANYRRPLMPSSFYGQADGRVLRAGYFFSEGRGTDGELKGCWAFPKLETYSGGRTFWLDYESGFIHPFDGTVVEQAAPKASALGQPLSF